jgi:serine/threonine protein kinase
MRDAEVERLNLIGIIDTSEVSLPAGWRGRVVVRAAGGRQYPKLQWEKLLAEPEKLFEGAQQTLKVDGQNTVTVKGLDIGDGGVKAVIKRRYPGGGIRGFLKSLWIAHSMLNFSAAVMVRQNWMPVALPLAAVYRRKFLSCGQSIYISEYVEGANLYEFLKNLQPQDSDRYRIMRELSKRMAGIFEWLHRINLWHRDAKATNFVVNQDSDGKYQVVITDVDGIKRYISKSEDRQMQGLWQLASTVMGLEGITRTDYLRTFKIYCDYVGLAKERRRDIYQMLAEKAKAKFRKRQARQGR